MNPKQRLKFPQRFDVLSIANCFVISYATARESFSREPIKFPDFFFLANEVKAFVRMLQN